jgi:hypothetical protein
MSLVPTHDGCAEVQVPWKWEVLWIVIWCRPWQIGGQPRDGLAGDLGDVQEQPHPRLRSSPRESGSRM